MVSKDTMNDLATNHLKDRIETLMASKLQDDEEFSDTIGYIQRVIGDGTSINERRLQLALQNRELAMNRQFLENFESINKEVQNFVDKVRTMNTICSELSNRIQTNKERTQELLQRTATLQTEKKHLLTQQAYLNTFFAKFSLSDSDEIILNGGISEMSVTEPFLKCLKKLCTIDSNIEEALKGDVGNVSLMEMLRTTKEKIDAAYDALFRATQRECRLLNVEFLELKPILHMSLEALQIRKPLFDTVMEEYSNARRSYVVRAFIDALTKGKGSTKPIEQSASDSLRYISDMLNWIHQSLQTEEDLLQSLLKSCAAELIVPITRNTGCVISEALCQPLKLRVEQTLTRENNCIVLYRLTSLFVYYIRQFSTSTSEESVLVKSINGLYELSSNMFFSVVSSTVQRLLSNMGAPDYDLTPVQSVNQTLLLLRDILESQNDLAFSAVIDKKELYAKIFAHILDPLNQSIQLVCSNLHSPLDVAVYMLNCLNAVRTVIMMYQYTDSKLEMIKAQIEANEDVLVSEQASSILIKTGMLDIYSKCVAHQPNQGPLSKISGMEEERIQNALNAFYGFLLQREGFQCAELAKISSARNRDNIRKRTFENVVNAYRVVYSKLSSADNLYTNLKLKSYDEISAALS